MAGVVAIVLLALIKDEALITINGLQFAGIIYLARIAAKQGERLARIEGRLDGQGDGGASP